MAKTPSFFRVDLHNHTTASGDALTTPEQLIGAAIEKGITSLAVTDHDSTANNRDVDILAKGRIDIIPGEEVMCKEGELIGLFLLEEIKPSQPAEVVMEEIHAQGGLIYAPHPFDPLRHGINNERLLSKVDIIEVFNAKNSERSDKKAWDFAEELGLLKGAGSDSHRPEEIGRAFVEVDGPIRSPEELILRLKRGKPVIQQRTSLAEKIFRRAQLFLGKN